MKALGLLARRELSEAQLRDRLARHGYEPTAVDGAIERLRRERAIDDRRTAEAIARREVSGKRHGRSRAQLAIERAGIDRAAATRALDEVFSSIDDEALLQAALAKRLPAGSSIARGDDRQLQRLYRYLVGRGFEPERVIALLRARQER